MNDVKRVSPAEAHSLMSAGYIYLDVRTEDEFGEGHPEGAINISFELRASSEKQADFVARVKSTFAIDQKICVGCQSGVRSIAAARLLVEHGFTNVTEQRAGWDGARGSFGEITEPGWKRSSLPREP